MNFGPISVNRIHQKARGRWRHLLVVGFVGLSSLFCEHGDYEV